MVQRRNQLMNDLFRSSKNDYNEIRSETESPRKERRRCIESKSGKKIAKKYHMSWEDAEKYRKNFDDTGEFYNPYRGSGIYHTLIQALYNLGVNNKHSFCKIKSEIKRIMLDNKSSNKKNAWHNFINKKSSNVYVAIDVNGRIIETARMLQRVRGYHVYGEKLRQMRMSIDIYIDNNGLPMYELNTTWKSYDEVDPINQYKRQKSKRIK